MKKTILFLLLMLLITITSIVTVNGNSIGPGRIYVRFTGFPSDLQYEATIITKDDYQVELDDLEDDHPFKQYTDHDGYKYLGHQVKRLTGDDKEIWYWTPQTFKFVILTTNDTLYVTKELNRYSYDAYYLIDISEVLNEDSNSYITIENVSRDFNYVKEAIYLLLRIIVTITIEILIAIAFLYREKRQLIFILIVNVVTQILLNVLINISTRSAYGLGVLFYIILIIILEIIIFTCEAITYKIKFKGLLKPILYAFVANLVSFAASILLWALLK